MAFVDVEDDGPQNNGEFFQFKAIGDRIDGFYAGTVPSTSQYAKEGGKAHRFYTKEGMKVVDPLPVSLYRQLTSSAQKELLKIGSPIQIVYSGEKAVDNGTMKQFKCRVDPVVHAGALKTITEKFPAPSAGAANAKPKDPPKPKNDDPFGGSSGGTDDDIPF